MIDNFKKLDRNKDKKMIFGTSMLELVINEFKKQSIHVDSAKNDSKLLVEACPIP